MKRILYAAFALLLVPMADAAELPAESVYQMNAPLETHRGETLAFVLQWTLAGATAVALCLLWKSRAAFNLKAAGLAVGVLLVPPYLFMYDGVTLAVAMAFLFREMQTSGARPGEHVALACALVLVLIFPLVKLPVGFIATVIVAALIARRALTARAVQGAMLHR